jgi:hypothetical protein
MMDTRSVRVSGWRKGHTGDRSADAFSQLKQTSKGTYIQELADSLSNSLSYLIVVLTFVDTLVRASHTLPRLGFIVQVPFAVVSFSADSLNQTRYIAKRLEYCLLELVVR